MKKIKLIIPALLFFAAIHISAQNTETVHPTVFKYSKAKEPTQFIGWPSSLNNYVVVESEGTAEENYIKVMDYIKTVYKNPEEVIISESKNKFIKINGVGSLIYYQNVMFMGKNYDIRYNLTILVKQGKMKVEITSLEYLIPVDTVNINTGIHGWRSLNSIYIHKTNGKPKKRVFGKTDVNIEKYFNSLVNGMVKYEVLGKESSKSDW